MQKDKKTIDDLFKSKLGNYQLGDASDGWTEFAGKWSTYRKFSFFRGGNGLLSYSIISSVVIVSLISVLIFNKTETEALYLPASQDERITLASSETAPIIDENSDIQNIGQDISNSEPGISPAYPAKTSVVSESGSLAVNQPTNNLKFAHKIITQPEKSSESVEESIAPVDIETNYSAAHQLPAGNLILPALKPLSLSLPSINPPRSQADTRKFKLKRPAGLWSLTLFTSLAKNSSPLSLTNPLFAENFNYLRNQLHSTQSQEYGFRISWSKKDWLFETGLSMLEIRQTSSDLQENLSFQQNFYYNVFDTSYVVVDTVGTYFQILNNDTTWFYFTNNQIINSQDSVLMSSTDTILNYVPRNEISRIRYIDIPLIAAYRLPIGPLTAIPKAGIIASILQSAQGNLIDGPGSSDILPINQSLLPKLRMDLYLAVEATYPLGGPYYLSAEGFFRRSLSDEYYTPYISRRLNRNGIKIGIGMNF